MARTRKPGRITIGSRAVAVAIMGEAIRAASEGAGRGLAPDELADKLVSMAWDVEYKPTAERLVLIIDAGVTSSDKMRSTPEDEFHPLSEDDRCAYISNGKRCLLPREHIGDHDLED